MWVKGRGDVVTAAGGGAQDSACGAAAAVIVLGGRRGPGEVREGYRPVPDAQRGLAKPSRLC